MLKTLGFTKKAFLGMKTPMLGYSHKHVSDELGQFKFHRDYEYAARSAGDYEGMRGAVARKAESSTKIKTMVAARKARKKAMRSTFKTLAPWTAGLEAPMAFHDIKKTLKASRL